MRIIIRQCKNCPFDENCQYRETIKSETKDIKGVTAVIKQCPEYKSIFKKGERVIIKTNEQYYNDSYDENGRRRFPEILWKPGPTARGTITGKIINKGLFQIKLDNPIHLKRCMDDKIENMKMENYYKHPTEIKKLCLDQFDMLKL